MPLPSSHPFLKIYPQLRGFYAMQQINQRWIREITTGGALHTEILGVVTLTLLDVLIPMVPVVTGTLQAAQLANVDPDEGMAWIRTARIKNPLFGEFADEYVNDVHQRKPFYDDALVESAQLIEAQVYDQVAVWLSS